MDNGPKKRTQVQVFLHAWEHRFLSRLRQMRKLSPEFYVLVHFAENRVTIHGVKDPEKLTLDDRKP